jgi:hypothetical protein
VLFVLQDTIVKKELRAQLLVRQELTDPLQEVPNLLLVQHVMLENTVKPLEGALLQVIVMLDFTAQQEVQSRMPLSAHWATNDQQELVLQLLVTTQNIRTKKVNQSAKHAWLDIFVLKLLENYADQIKYQLVSSALQDNGLKLIAVQERSLM